MHRWIPTKSSIVHILHNDLICHFAKTSQNRHNIPLTGMSRSHYINTASSRNYNSFPHDSRPHHFGPGLLSASCLLRWPRPLCDIDLDSASVSSLSGNRAAFSRSPDLSESEVPAMSALAFAGSDLLLALSSTTVTVWASSIDGSRCLADEGPGEIVAASGTARR